ncbi:MAG: phage holin family protein [Betaproteobacteria bacterium]|nr:MAG: phage holin family protein [Betaproteobacteria bacterium]
MAEREGAAARGGLLRSIKHLAGKLLGAAQTRLEILATEIEEERMRLEQLLLIALAAAFCLGMGIVLCVALVVVYYWDTHRLAAIGILAAGFIAAGALLGWILRDKAKTRPKPFAITRGELVKDRAMLREPET